MPRRVARRHEQDDLLVANVTGRVQRPAREQRLRLLRARGGEHVGRRAALDLALQRLEPAKLYVGDAVDLGERRAQRRRRVDRRRRLRGGGRREERRGGAGRGSVVAWGHQVV